MRATDNPAAAKYRGSRPQVRPSLRLFTNPACEHAERAFLGERREPEDLAGGEVPVEVVGAADVAGGLVEGVPSGFADDSVEMRSPRAAKARPRWDGQGPTFRMWQISVSVQLAGSRW